MSSYQIEQVEQDGIRLTISYDSDIESPREWGNDSKMVCFHKRYSLPNEIDFNKDDYNSFSEMRRAIEKEYDVCCILPVWMYDHSGISLSTGRTCEWDSIQIGFIFLTKENARQQHKCKRISKRIKDMVEKNLIAEIEIYGQYLNGDVYDFALERALEVKVRKTYSTGEVKEEIEIEYEDIDSCGGFYNKADMKDNVSEEYYKLFDAISNIR